MKRNYFLSGFALLFILFLIPQNMKAQSTGDIAFVGFNVDGDDDFSIVALADIAANSTIYFTDDETTGLGTPSALIGSEGTITWQTGANIIKAGTVVTFTDVDLEANPDFGASIGSIGKSGSFDLSGSKDGLIAYTGTGVNAPTTYLAALQIGNNPAELGPFDGDGITLTNTGLVIGTTITVIDSPASPRGGSYTGSRSVGTSFADYKVLIANQANWQKGSANGYGEALLPFSEEAFTINTTNWTGASNSTWDNAGNWDNGIPTSSSLANIPNVATAPVIGASTSVTVGNLKITEPDGLVIESEGSLIVKGTSTGNVTYKRTLSKDADNSKAWHLVSAPVTTETVTSLRTNNSFALGTGSNIGLATYTHTDNSWNYFTTASANAVSSGTGMSAKLDNGAAVSTISFTGTLPNANVSVPLVQGPGANYNYNLLGNPFPSSINISDFLLSNTNEIVDETMWVWNGTSYETRVTANVFKVAPGQGFFVEAKTTSNFVFSRGIQSHKIPDDFMKSEARTEIKLLVSDTKTSRYADIYYIEGKTTGFDLGYDGKLFGGIQDSFSVFTHLVADSIGTKYQIQSLPNYDYENMVVPIGVHVAAGKEVTFTTKVSNLPEGIKVFIEDKENNTFTRLDEANSTYSFTATEALNDIGRFYLHTRSSALSTHEVSLQNISMYKTNNTNLRIAGLLQGENNVKIFTILGKQILNTSFTSNGVKDITLPKLSTGIYIVQLETETGKLNKKIILE